MSSIHNVTVVGASGRLGKPVLDQLLSSNELNIQVLKRTGSTSTYAADIKVLEVDYEDLESMKAAFQGQDAVVSLVGDGGVLGQKLMIDAAIATGVKRFLPSNFGSNMTNHNSRKLPVFAQKVIVEDYLIEKSKTTQLTYSFVYTGGFTDFAIRHNILMDFSKYTPTIYNGGTTEFSTTSMPTVGDAIAGVLLHPAETRNRPVYVSEIIFSQNQLLRLAKQIAPSKPWAPIDVDLNVVAKSAEERLSQGIHDLPTIIPILLKSILGPEYGVKFTENDNELLGIKVKTEDYLVELLTPMISQ